MPKNLFNFISYKNTEEVIFIIDEDIANATMTTYKANYTSGVTFRAN
jgi:hypothetical protein